MGHDPFLPFHVPANHSEGYECLDKKTDSKPPLPPQKPPAWQQRDVEPQSHNGNVWSELFCLRSGESRRTPGRLALARASPPC